MPYKVPYFVRADASLGGSREACAVHHDSTVLIQHHDVWGWWDQIKWHRRVAAERREEDCVWKETQWLHPRLSVATLRPCSHLLFLSHASNTCGLMPVASCHPSPFKAPGPRWGLRQWAEGRMQADR